MPRRQRKKEDRSNIVPVLNGPLVCDAAVRDPASGKWNLIGLFNNLSASQFPTSRPMSVYVLLADAEGKYDVEVRFVNSAPRERLAGANIAMEVRDRLASSDFAVGFPPLPIPEEGDYEFQVWANDAFLGAVTLTALLRNAPRSR